MMQFILANGLLMDLNVIYNHLILIYFASILTLFILNQTFLIFIIFQTQKASNQI